MRYQSIFLFFLFSSLLIVFISCAQPESKKQASLARMEKMARSVTIYRDTYGVPHVYGPTDASVVFGFMYARAEDRFSIIEQNYILTLGRNAEVNGANALYLDILSRAQLFPD